MLEFKNVHFAYPGGEPVLNGIDLKLAEGEHVGLIGANGAGKSTLMKAALGLIYVEGDILVDDTKVSRDTLSEIRSKLGFVLQDSDSQMFMPTVLDDMIFGPMNYGMSKDEAVALAEETLEKLGISHLRDRHNHRISGGEKRMAAIATILAMKPKLMLMDEPSTALDPCNRRKLITTLNELPVTKIIASHDLDMILETCDRVVLIDNGKVVADGETLTILSNKKLLEEHRLELPYCLAGIPMKPKRISK
ncbi:MAG: ABC transporter ATP-binding protein [Firmicutes bacterium]|nr:ABC transporter ATP-binding protein [Bacillota bacterium]